MNVKEDFKFKLPILWINAIAESILARFDVFCLLFSVAQQGQRNGLLGKAVMCSLLTLARECVGGKRVFWAWNISFHGEKESIEPVLSILPYLVVFSPILYLMCTSSA